MKETLMSNQLSVDVTKRRLALLCVLCLFAAGCSPNTQQSASTAPPDPSRYNTFEAKQQACERGELDMCADVGMAYIKGEGIAKDKERGLKYLNKGCDGKVPKACFGLGVNLLMQGSGTAEEVIKGVASIRQACDDKFGEACFFLGTISAGLIKLEGLERNEALAKDYYKKACDYGHQQSCSLAK
jgi:TPR repeat protein